MRRKMNGVTCTAHGLVDNKNYHFDAEAPAHRPCSSTFAALLQKMYAMRNGRQPDLRIELYMAGIVSLW